MDFGPIQNGFLYVSIQGSGHQHSFGAERRHQRFKHWCEKVLALFLIVLVRQVKIQEQTQAASNGPDAADSFWGFVVVWLPGRGESPIATFVPVSRQVTAWQRRWWESCPLLWNCRLQKDVLVMFAMGDSYQQVKNSGNVKRRKWNSRTHLRANFQRGRLVSLLPSWRATRVRKCSISFM